MALTALALVCSLKPSPAPSSSELMAQQLLTALAEHDVTGDTLRVIDHDVKPGVERDMGEGDAWPAILERVHVADILIIATPTWMGHPSSVTHRVLERLDAEIAEKGPDGLPVLFGKVAVAAVVGNEDGAHLVSAEVFQALNDVGFTIPAQGVSYWNGEAMGKVDYRDLDKTPDVVQETIATVASNAAHLATLLTKSPYTS